MSSAGSPISLPISALVSTLAAATALAARGTPGSARSGLHCSPSQRSWLAAGEPLLMRIPMLARSGDAKAEQSERIREVRSAPERRQPSPAATLTAQHLLGAEEVPDSIGDSPR